MKNIILVGFMGAGKTAVGKTLARLLKRKFVDLDEKIEEREGMPISEIFTKKGEQYFRKAEREVVKKASLFTGLVTATGGGAVIDKENVVNLRSNGILFYLDASPTKILERTKGHTHRPLLNVSDPEEKISELLAKRAEFYAQADHRIDTNNLSVDEVAEKIISLLKEDGAIS
ncbi:MAG: shikimate kinase [Candidatus Omnitrophica bacterium]|nr:shikimate kinase [Candidatus Omnitrophota bacterium]MDD5310835.1 shikimate kinase [Candidatus Omnitrophota bacterium]MDD5546780.1 shikimate kinase [Candidatus Omnitrophota bacterium]